MGGRCVAATSFAPSTVSTSASHTPSSVTQTPGAGGRSRALVGRPTTSFACGTRSPVRQTSTVALRAKRNCRWRARLSSCQPLIHDHDAELARLRIGEHLVKLRAPVERLSGTQADSASLRIYKTCKPSSAALRRPFFSWSSRRAHKRGGCRLHCQCTPRHRRWRARHNSCRSHRSCRTPRRAYAHPRQLATPAHCPHPPR